MSRCVPIQTNVNTAEPFFVLAQGGGGGGGSGNINTSSITFVSSLTFVDSDVPPSGSIIRPPMILSVDNDATTLQVNSTDPGSGYAFWLTCPSPATGPRGLITCRNPSGGGGLQDMGIVANSLDIQANSLSLTNSSEANLIVTQGATAYGVSTASLRVMSRPVSGGNIGELRLFANPNGSQYGSVIEARQTGDGPTAPQMLNIVASQLNISTLSSVSINANLNVSSINGAPAVSAPEVSTLQGQVAALMLLAGL